MHVKNWATIRRSISLCALSLLGVIASISSIKRRQGATFYKQMLKRDFPADDPWCLTFASSKVSRRVFSDSPDIPDTIEGAEMLRKGIPSSYQSQSFPLKGTVCEGDNAPLQLHWQAWSFHSQEVHGGGHLAGAERRCVDRSPDDTAASQLVLISFQCKHLSHPSQTVWWMAGCGPLQRKVLFVLMVLPREQISAFV